MKVKCKNSKNEARKFHKLTPDGEYVVLAVEISSSSAASSKFMGDFTLYRLRDDEGLVKLFPANLFAIISNKMFSRWIFHHIKYDFYSILPQSWARDSFWEDYYNDDKNAIEDFNREEEAMLLEEI